MINAFPFLLGPLGSPAQGNGQTGEIGLDQSTRLGKPSDNPFAAILRDQFGDTLPFKILKLTVPFTSFGVKGRSVVSEGEIAQDQLGLSHADFSYAEQLSPAVLSPQVFLAGGADGVPTQTTINQPDLPSPAVYSAMQAQPVGNSLSNQNAAHMVANSFLRDAVGSGEWEPPIESAVEPEKTVGKPVTRVSSPVQDADILLLGIPPQSAKVPKGSLRPLDTQAFQAPLPFEETPAGLADVIQSTQARLKYPHGVSSLLRGGSIEGKESSLALSSDFIMESSLSSSGDRSKDVFEVTSKGMGVDFNAGGQGNNNGLGGFKYSQSGFQQFSSSLSPGSGIRMAEERAADLPAPALQRLQMDVQLSETNRIQIDVGVQHRQVYAGLLMDQATLKNLAIQFAPQLEEQLAQGDMDLQEFSAEVRDHHHEPESETRSHGLGTQHGNRGSTPVHHAPDSVKRAEEQGFHLVA